MFHMRVTRLLLQDFRGWTRFELQPSGHVLLAGVPRGGRSDVIAALRRVLDSTCARSQPSLNDIRQMGAARALPSAPLDPGVDAASTQAATPTLDPAAGGAEDLIRVPFALVEVTLADLDPELEQLCDGHLEPLAGNGQVDDGPAADPAAPLGIRLAYRLTYDATADSLEAVTYFPARSNPEAAQYFRVPMAVRLALPVISVTTLAPLQLRADGELRRLLQEWDAGATVAAFDTLRDAVAAASMTLSANPTIAGAVSAVMGAGDLAAHLSDDPTGPAVNFVPDDGSLSALLRSLQPALRLDDAGFLPLTSHGSTTAAVLSAAEALLIAATPGAVLLVDDLGDRLDGPTSEHVASLLRARAGQAWVSTRRPEVARAFEPMELVRLTRHGGVRAWHTVTRPTDRKSLAVERLLHTQLLPALTSPAVVILEGPHDLTAYAWADRWRTASAPPLAASGARMIFADNGSGGGTGQIPRVATLARQLGFRVVALIDGDRPSDSVSAALTEIEDACDAVITLPEGIALEAALTYGVDVEALRAAGAFLTSYGIPDPTADKGDDEVASALWQPLHKHGLHEPFLEAVSIAVGLPPLVGAALDSVATAVREALGPQAAGTAKTRTVSLPPSGDSRPVGSPA